MLVCVYVCLYVYKSFHAVSFNHAQSLLRQKLCFCMLEYVLVYIWECVLVSKSMCPCVYMCVCVCLCVCVQVCATMCVCTLSVTLYYINFLLPCSTVSSGVNSIAAVVLEDLVKPFYVFKHHRAMHDSLGAKFSQIICEVLYYKHN